VSWPVLADPADAARTIVAVVPIDYHLEFLASFRRTLWLMIASSVVLMSLMGWLAVRQGHAPLREIVGRIRQISGNELDSTVAPEAVPRELTDLAESFNAMLARVNRSFQQLTHSQRGHCPRATHTDHESHDPNSSRTIEGTHDRPVPRGALLEHGGV
jgi:methyl-accepting chemotaxis protein